MSSDKIIRFWNFINTKKVLGPNQKYTHVRVGFYPFTGKYNFSDKNDYQTFLELYSDIVDIVDMGDEMNFAEKQKAVGPLLMDYDFRFNDQNRAYTKTDIEKLTDITDQIILKYINIKNTNINTYLFEKNNPTYDQSHKNYKDGFHICYMLPFTIEQRYFIFNKVSEEIKLQKIFEHLKYTNPINDILDISTMSRNSWVMYGSHKLKSQKYDLTYVFTFDKVLEKTIVKFNTLDFVKLFSVRQFCKKDALKYKEDTYGDIKKELDEINIKYIKKKGNEQHIKIHKNPTHTQEKNFFIINI